MVMTAVAPPSMTTSDMTSTPCCPNCGFASPLPPLDETQSALLQAQRQIDDLQAQVRLLNEKASAAVDRWADYEDELARLRATLDQHQHQRQSTSTTASSAPTTAASPARSSFLPSGAADRISALLSPRKPLPALPPSSSSSRQGPAAPPDSTTDDLMEELSRERSLRREAEGRLSETSRQVEDLSVSLFEQANEMVATERRARAKLEERVEVLELREWEKRSRLERLEAAVERIQRVKRVLGETSVPKEEAVGAVNGVETGREA